MEVIEEEEVVRGIIWKCRSNGWGRVTMETKRLAGGGGGTNGRKRRGN